MAFEFRTGEASYAFFDIKPRPFEGWSAGYWLGKYAEDILATYFKKPEGGHNLELFILVGSIVSLVETVAPAYRQQALYSRFQTEASIPPAHREDVARQIVKYLKA